MELKLNIKDKRLLYELEKDSRNSLNKIAKKIGVSKEVANYRLKRLIDKGLIQKFISIIDYYSLGYEKYRLLINLYNLKENTKDEIINELKNIENSTVTILLQSHWDLEIDIWVKKASEFQTFYNKIIEKFSEYIQNKEFSLITKVYHLKHSYLYKKQDEIILGNYDNIKIDETDYKILKILEEDGKINLIEISKKLKLPTTTLNYRLKNLKSKKIIKSVIPILNVDLMGYDTHKIQITLNNTSKKTTLISYLSTQKNITKIFDLIGKVDLEFEVDFKTTKELDDFLTELRIKVPYIKDFEVITVQKINL